MTTGTITTRVLKNRINARIEGMEFHLRPIRVNEDLRGTSGFIRNPENGAIVYVDTERPVLSHMNDLVLYRRAGHLKDFTGERNHFGERKGDAYADEIADMLAV